MKKDTRESLLLFAVIVIVAIAILGFLTLSFMTVSNANTQELLNQSFDNADQKMAINYLIQSKGMILEVQALSRKGISDTVLLEELKRITSLSYNSNKYLDDFAFVIPDTSDVGESCEELISQINNQISIIESGAKGE